MFALVLVAGLCYLAGAAGLALFFLAPDGFSSPSNLNITIYTLAAGLLFHALSKILDEVKQINDSLKKIAKKE